MAKKKDNKNDNKFNSINKPLILTRKEAISYVAGILSKQGYRVIVHENGISFYCAWIEVWLPASDNVPGDKWIGNLNLTLMGTFYTTNMAGFYRRGVLLLIPDELEIKSSPREMYTAKKYDYGFWEEE